MQHATATMSDAKLGQSQEWGYSVARIVLNCSTDLPSDPGLAPDAARYSMIGLGRFSAITTVYTSALLHGEEGREPGVALESVADLDEV